MRAAVRERVRELCRAASRSTPTCRLSRCRRAAHAPSARLRMTGWSPDSWRRRPAAQQPVYARPGGARGASVGSSRRCRRWSPAGRSRRSRASWPRPPRGEAFLLQGGDCAESFDDCRSEAIASKLKILLQMSLVLVHGSAAAGDPRRPLRRPVRQAALGRHRGARRRRAAELPRRPGQPRRRSPPRTARPIPQLLLRGYERAALTLNFIRALVDGGFADLHHPEYWDLDFVEHSPLADEYRRDGRRHRRVAALHGDARRPRASAR